MPVAGIDDRLAREEADLVARIAAGDVEAPVAELSRRYAGQLYRYGQQTLGGGGLAEETVQECFVRLWRTAGQYDPRRGSVAAYLILLALSAAADVRKRLSSRPLMPLQEAWTPPKADAVDEILTGLVVREAVDSHGEGHRQMMPLAQAGLTQSKIAARLGLLGTVKTQTFHALRAALIKRGVDVAA